MAFLLIIFSPESLNYLAYLIALFIHEIGHLLMATLFKWRLETLKLTAIGAFLTFENHLSRPPLQSFLVAAGGMLFNGTFALFLIGIDGSTALIYTNFAVIIFNLLPISPLDGSHMLKSLLRLKLPYRKVVKVVRIVHPLFLILFLGGVIIWRLDQYLVVAIFLAAFVIQYEKKHLYLIQRQMIQGI